MKLSVTLGEIAISWRGEEEVGIWGEKGGEEEQGHATRTTKRIMKSQHASRATLALGSSARPTARLSHSHVNVLSPSTLSALQVC